ncbi:MAG: hypothetical protein L0Y71_19520 [Gemmataceae bacterium]|nr:hypothetical protein [Gemmataceae bacterium]
MKQAKPRQTALKLTGQQLRQLRKDRELIAKELPDLIAKHQRLCEAAAEPTHSGALRRAIHSSKILLDDLADRAATDLNTLDAFLTGTGTLSSDVIDRLTNILKLNLRPSNGKAKPRTAKAS